MKKDLQSRYAYWNERALAAKKRYKACLAKQALLVYEVFAYEDPYRYAHLERAKRLVAAEKARLTEVQKQARVARKKLKEVVAKQAHKRASCPWCRTLRDLRC